MEIKINGIAFIIDFSFILIMALVTLCGYKDGAMVMLFCSLHELGHLFALLVTGNKPTRLRLAFFGFAISYDDVLSRRDEAFVLLCGPIVNFIMWLILGDSLNAVLFFLNILPVFPLDGGRVAKLYLPQKTFFAINVIFMAAMLFSSVYLMIKFHSVSLLLITVYLIISGIRI